MANLTAKRPKRMLFGATCFADARGSIDLAVVVAKTLNLDISAYLLEDEAVLLASRLPNARATTIMGSSLPVTDSMMRDAFARDAQAFEQALATTAGQSRLRWSFTRIAGDFETVLGREADHIGLSLLGYNWIQKPRTDGDSSVVVVAQKDDVPALVDRFADPISQEVGGRIETFDIEPEFEPSRMIDFLQRKCLTAVVVPMDVAKKAGIENILNAGRCPVIVLDGQH